LGHGLIAPPSGGFVHVDELVLESCGDDVCFAISSALSLEFLPARRLVLEQFLAAASCVSSCEGAALASLALLHERPATAGIPAIGEGVERLLARERALPSGLSNRTLGGRPRGAH
ncbi:MAG TPA: hypothetical protein VK034_08170, partial [Enhygromyxa sp.]|nr:hypothetical protein [Enhygromyxa sp.]